jgi:glyoxylase-like metal-dependent hydrolase (beta-lactamase superfamily II)
VTWERVNLGFVSAYILARGDEAAIVDTGVGGSADAIEASLTGIGLDWSAVAHLVLTHKHGDHVGSAAEVMDRAPDAAAYAGREDIGSISLPRELVSVGDGDQVFGLQVVTTPGHTPGSICVLDPVTGLLVAGDALRTERGRPALPGTQFTEDLDMAKQSIIKLGKLTFETLLVGHGEPIEGGASQAVAGLGASG